jgi:hypothetical protein
LAGIATIDAAEVGEEHRTQPADIVQVGIKPLVKLVAAR